MILWWMGRDARAFARLGLVSKRWLALTRALPVRYLHESPNLETACTTQQLQVGRVRTLCLSMCFFAYLCLHLACERKMCLWIWVFVQRWCVHMHIFRSMHKFRMLTRNYVSLSILSFIDSTHQRLHSIGFQNYRNWSATSFCLMQWPHPCWGYDKQIHIHIHPRLLSHTYNKSLCGEPVTVIFRIDFPY